MTHTKPSQLSSLDDWLCYLESIHPVNIDMGLSRVKAVGEKLGYTQLKNVILVAGTNGKGTTCRALEALLLAQGLSVVTYASPHIVRYNERVRFNGKELDDSYHVNAFNALELGRGEISLTYFEFGTLAALELCKQLEPDYIVLEVGLGGRLDATNIVDPIISVITTVDLDHKEFLGDTRELVGREKAGIFRANKTAVVGDLAVPNSVLEYAKEIGTPLLIANQDYQFTLTDGRFNYQRDSFTLNCPAPNIPAQNVATALTTLAQLSLLPSNDVICEVLANLVVEGRFQTLLETPKVIADVAHNPESARYLASKLTSLVDKGIEPVLLVGMLKDKDQQAVFNELAAFRHHWHVATLHCYRGDTAANVEHNLAQTGISESVKYDSVAQAINAILPTLTNMQALIIFGSFYTVSDAIVYWQNEE